MNRTTRTLGRIAASVVAVTALGLSACGSDDGPDGESNGASDAVTMTDAWSRQPAQGQTNSAVYGVLTNDSDAPVTVSGATSSVTDDVELHETLMDDDGQMSMQQREGGFELAAGASLTFEPGGPHIMLLGIDPATYPDTVDVTLDFDDDTSIEFDAEVRAIDG